MSSLIWNFGPGRSADVPSSDWFANTRTEGRPPTNPLPDPTGRTELAILAETLELHGLDPAHDDLLAQYAFELARQYEEDVQELGERGRALPGASEALAAVAELPTLLQTVLTGNLRAVAMVKLRAFGLDNAHRLRDRRLRRRSPPMP